MTPDEIVAQGKRRREILRRYRITEAQMLEREQKLMPHIQQVIANEILDAATEED